MVSRLTGLSPHVIRVWEKRYGAVIPARTGTNRRLYSDEEVERLRLLAQATEAGHKIGIIARWGMEELRRLVAVVGPAVNGSPVGVRPPVPGGTPGSRRDSGDDLEPPLRRDGPGRGETRSEDQAGAGEGLNAALEAAASFDADRFVAALEAATVRWGLNGMLHRLIGPLAFALGDRWQRGELTAAHEHFATGIIREFLTRASRPFLAGETAPRAIVATPAGQVHELGAVMASATAANHGWRPVYLGASLPAGEIAGAAIQNDARAVLLSIIFPPDDPHVAGELRQLRRYLPKGTAILVGGRSAPAYRPVLEEIGARCVGDLAELGHLLENLRAARGNP